MEGFRILVIDDEAVILKMLVIALSTKGYQVDTADSGEQGIIKLQANDYDLVITDMALGKMTGENVLQEIRHLKGVSFPVIAMSGNSCMIDEHLFDAVLPKPYSLKLLFDLLENMISPKGDYRPDHKNRAPKDFLPKHPAPY